MTDSSEKKLIEIRTDCRKFAKLSSKLRGCENTIKFHPFYYLVELSCK